MANNRMWLVCGQTGKRVMLAKHTGGAWSTWDDARNVDATVERAFRSEMEESAAPWGGTTWRIEYDRTEPEIDEATRVARLPMKR